MILTGGSAGAGGAIENNEDLTAAAAATLGSFEVAVGVIDDEISADGFEDAMPPPR